MSIPGLGQIPVQQTPSTTRTITLKPLWEWRFESPFPSSTSTGGHTLASSSLAPPTTSPSSSSSTTAPPTSLTVKLTSGTAERDGTELALGKPYVLAGAKSKISTLTGCTLEVSGPCDDYVAECEDPDDWPAVSYLNLHFALQNQRWRAASGGVGPRVLIAGAPASGKSTLARTLLALATRQDGGQQPVGVGLDPRDGMLSLPGTVSAAVFGSVMDVETGGAGVADTPSSGPAAVPVKVPVVYYYGRQRVEDEPAAWRTAVSALAGAVRGRREVDGEVRRAGVVVDAPAVGVGKDGVGLLVHVVEEFAVNVVVVLGSGRLNAELQKSLGQMRTSLGEPITVVQLDKSEGVVERDEAFMQQTREAAIKEYFFGDAKMTLSPATQQVEFGAVTIYKIPDLSEYLADEEVLEKMEPVPEMAHWCLTVMNASVRDPLETIRYASVMGFVYVADVEPERRRLKILAPVSGRLGDRPLVWGHWPEPHINLLG
ncbi:mRNA cleavage and polyadenylation factor CLP1 [Coniochaeta hoffmannii]|uniref:Polynucleotide 5'-hydroxyl-kinase GRC3 n=1 Tax=Coniochaeta hoffmannii TaxID=91930 RepID=A0AA38RZ74_9PEZI|nr:mRNA cleavage and polyadenylation factor CLP1 [Coniochaeta hoffmannii]